MSNEHFTLSKFSAAGIALALFLSGCGQMTDVTAMGRASTDGTAAEQGEVKILTEPLEPTVPADPADFMESSTSEPRSLGVLGAPSSNFAVGSDGESIAPLAPAPSATEAEGEAPSALAFVPPSTSTTATPAASASNNTASNNTASNNTASNNTASNNTETTTTRAPATTPTTRAPSTTTTTAPPAAATATTATPTPTTATPTTATPTTATPTTTAAAATVAGRYTIAQVIDGTISAGDGSNPNEEAPMGRHDAPLSLNQGWNWATGPTRNSVWGELGTGGSQYAEWRCAVIPESGHTPSVPFRVNVREGAYYQYANSNWQKAFDVDLTGGNHGGYLGTAGETNGNPFDSGSHGLIEWRQEADGSFSAPWNPDALMMHFWASKREAPASGQTAEFLTSEFRLQQPDGQTVDLSQVQVLFQCGVDYYAVTTGQGTQVPGPGIGKYHRLTTQWEPSLWVTLPKDTPANSVSDFRTWLEANLPPGVSN